MKVWRDKRDTFLKAIAQGKKYKLYLYTGAIYTKDNKFLKNLDVDTTAFILSHRKLFYNNKKNRKGHLWLDLLIENPQVLKEVKLELELGKALEHIPELA